MDKLCECGCKSPVNSKYANRRFIRGHSNKIRVYSDETKKKISQSNSGRTISPEVKEKISNALKGKKRATFSEETRKKMSESRKNRAPFKHSEETRKKMSESQKGRKHSEETKEKISIGNKGKSISEPTKEKLREAWARGSYKGVFLRSSKQEKKLAPIIEKLGFKNTIEENFYIHYNKRMRIPDFYNLETKEIIEIFGIWWHRDRPLPEGLRHETPEEYIEWYREAGWNCIVVWEDEFEEFYNKVLKETKL